MKKCMLLFAGCILFNQKGFTQANLANIRHEVMMEIITGQYRNAILIFENSMDK